jgi:Tol biopolymer transport system component
MEELVLGTPSNEWPVSWSKDGRFLLFYQDGGEKTAADLWALPMTGDDRAPIVVANTPFSERVGDFSPDGRWVAYETNESGRFEIVVQPFPNPRARWQVSTGGGVKPRWSADGKELYYIAPDDKLMAVKASAKDVSFQAQAPTPLFSTKIVLTGSALFKAQYAVTRDGRFLINETTGQATVSPITVIINWKPRVN